MKALILLSGGLDSTLAAQIMHREGLELLAVNFKTPFCLCDRKAGGCGSHSRNVADSLGIKFTMINATEEFLEVLKKPAHGYGANMNPCIDCRILFFRKSKTLMNEIGAEFIITGEVLGQRPMSQFKRQMDIIEKESGLEGLVVRPLSAQVLPPTIPEKKGWINRERLLSIEGRSRKTQIGLAKEFGINDYPCIAGGCLLTYPEFSKKVRDLIVHQALDPLNLPFLKTGRYFRLSSGALLVVGRNETENKVLTGLGKDDDHVFKPSGVGPIGVGRGRFDQSVVEIACRIVARYCDRPDNKEVTITYHGPTEGSLNVGPLDENELQKLRV